MSCKWKKVNMAKKVVGEVRLQIPAGAANPAPPVGPSLGQAGVNIMEFCKQFNAATQAQAGLSHTRRDHGLPGSFFHVHHQIASGGCAC
jgi:hypothetical protein